MCSFCFLLPGDCICLGKGSLCGPGFLRFVVDAVYSLSHTRLFANPWTVAHQAPPSMGFPRQECWSGVPLPSPSISWLLQIVLAASQHRGACSFSDYSFVENMLFMFLSSLIYSIKLQEAAMHRGSDYPGSDTSSGAY